MSWLRHVIIDLLVPVVIVAATFGGQVWAAWLLWIYTPLMLLLKLAALASGVQPKANDVPVWFFHAVYAVNVGLLLYHMWIWVAAGWAAIWLLSMIAEARARPKASK